MADRQQRRADRERLAAAPPAAGVIAVRHRTSGRLVVVGTENLAGARNRFDFAITMRSGSALPDLRLAADTREHGFDGLELEVLETIEVEPGTAPADLRRDLDILAGLWRERLTAAAAAPAPAAADATAATTGVDSLAPDA